MGLPSLDDIFLIGVLQIPSFTIERVGVDEIEREK
jgi:hypothetical protein